MVDLIMAPHDLLKSKTTTSHRKSYSQGFVPFSWEEKPGVPKFIHRKSPSDVGLSSSPKTRPNSYNISSVGSLEKPPTISLNPPPPFPRKSYSLKGLLCQEDPFVAALRSCSNSSHGEGYEGLRHKGNAPKGKNRSKSGTSVFSCKQSSDVENDNLVKFSKLPPLPKERYNARSFVTSLHFIN